MSNQQAPNQTPDRLRACNSRDELVKVLDLAVALAERIRKVADKLHTFGTGQNVQWGNELDSIAAALLTLDPSSRPRQ